MKPGDRFMLSSPYGELRRGGESALHAVLVVPNGAKGTVVGAGGTRTNVVEFDDLGGTVGVSVPAHWLAPEPESEDGR